MDKILWVDTETTGLSSWKNGIIQISGYVEIRGVEQAQFDYQVKPFPKDEVSNKALEVNGVDKETISSYPEPAKVYREFVGMLKDFINPFDKSDKFVLAGYNVNFDKGFLQSFFKKNGDNFFHSYFDYHILDVMSAAQIYIHKNGVKLPNIKLKTIAGHFGFDGDFHNAMDDIRITREVYKQIMRSMGG